MKKLISTLVGALLLCSASYVIAFETGYDLLQASSRGEFRAYVSGIMEGHMLSAAMYKLPQIACPAPDTTRQEIAGIVALYLINSPSENLDIPARTLVLTALAEHYTCE